MASHHDKEHSGKSGVLQVLDELLDIMSRDAAARNPDIAAELRNQSDACGLNPNLAERLTEMADAVERFHASVDHFATIEGMADLLALHRKFQFCWSVRFNRLLGAVWTDALRGGDKERQDALRRALRFLRDVYVAVYLIKQMPRDVDAWVAQTEENPLL
jgi:hypothetical protein